VGSSELFDKSEEAARAWIVRMREIYAEAGWTQREGSPQMESLLFTVCEMIRRLGGSEADWLAVARGFGAAEIETESIGWRKGYAAGKETMEKIHGILGVGA
jgi:hypothetical protein